MSISPQQYQRVVEPDPVPEQLINLSPRVWDAYFWLLDAVYVRSQMSGLAVSLAGAMGIAAKTASEWIRILRERDLVTTNGRAGWGAEIVPLAVEGCPLDVVTCNEKARSMSRDSNLDKKLQALKGKILRKYDAREANGRGSDPLVRKTNMLERAYEGAYNEFYGRQTLYYSSENKRHHLRRACCDLDQYDVSPSEYPDFIRDANTFWQRDHKTFIPPTALTAGVIAKFVENAGPRVSDYRPVAEWLREHGYPRSWARDLAQNFARDLAAGGFGDGGPEYHATRARAYQEFCVDRGRVSLPLWRKTLRDRQWQIDKDTYASEDGSLEDQIEATESARRKAASEAAWIEERARRESTADPEVADLDVRARRMVFQQGLAASRILRKQYEVLKEQRYREALARLSR